MRQIDADALLAALYEADAITPRGAKIIREFPAVKRNIYRWKGAGFGDYYCSRCNEVYSIGAEHVSEWNYCPSCGAKMKGEADT